MSILHTVTEEEQPTPDPCSAVVNDGRPQLAEADLVTDPAMLEAAARYAGDLTPDREIADAQAGRHPLQRRLRFGS